MLSVILINERRDTIMKTQAYVINVFKNKILTKGDYTKRWIELINMLERRKGANLTSNS